MKTGDEDRPDMDAPLIARVRFELFPGETSGRTRDYLSGVRPNHFIAELGHTVIGVVVFDRGRVELGDCEDATVSYPYHEPFARVLAPGLRYAVCEGTRVVGSVRVVSLLPGSAA